MAEDRFANQFIGSVTESSAGVLTFAELNFGMQLRDRVALVIDSIRWWLFVDTVALMTAAGDDIYLAITQSDSVASLQAPTDSRIVDLITLTRADFGTAASAGIFQMPLMTEFSPPLIMLPHKVYAAIASTGLASPVTAYLRIYYRVVNISRDEQLIEILEAMQQN